MADSSTQQKNGRYVQGGSTDVYKNRLGWWERETIAASDDDIEIEIGARYEGRPDRLAADYYGKSSYMWVVLQFNSILDINTEFTLGKTIRIPTYQRVLFEITTKPNNSNIIS